MREIDRIKKMLNNNPDFLGKFPGYPLYAFYEELEYVAYKAAMDNSIDFEEEIKKVSELYTFNNTSSFYENNKRKMIQNIREKFDKRDIKYPSMGGCPWAFECYYDGVELSKIRHKAPEIKP